jgi:hypothetical protein
MGTTGTRERLAQQVIGAVLDGGHPAAEAEAAGFNTAVVHRPAVVVAAETAGDVAAAVRYAHDEGLPVTVQATGHGASVPADGSVLVSTRRMRGVRVDPVARVARVEAGVRWRAVIDAAVPHGLAPLSGSSSGVGVVGYTLGGGLGHLARRHGFAADHVRAIDLVTATGELTTVTAQSDPELFWAVRGGQARFGIVTALELDLFPVPRFFGGAMLFTGPAVGDVLQAFSTWAPTMPEEVTTSVALLRLPPVDDVPPPLRGVVTLALRFGFTGSPEQGQALLAPMREVATTPVLDSVGPMSYAGVDGIHMDPTEPMPAVATGGLLGSMPAGLVDTLLGVAGPDVEVPLAMVELRLMGAALGRPPVVPNAVAGRDGAFSLSVVAPAPPPLLETAHAVTSGVVDALAPWSTGSSLVNFAGPAPASSVWAPDALERLRRVKATVDPRDVFGGGLAPSAAAQAGAR